TTAWFTVWPVNEVPPPRDRIGAPMRLAISTTAWTSPAWRGMTTPIGSIWYIEASVEYSRRENRSNRTSPSTWRRSSCSRSDMAGLYYVDASSPGVYPRPVGGSRPGGAIGPRLQRQASPGRADLRLA